MTDWDTPTPAVAGESWGAASATDTNNHNAHFGAPADKQSTTTKAQPPAAVDPKREEYKQRAQEAGWQDPVNVDYDMNQRNGDWAAGAAVYEWNDEIGDIAPEIPELEQHLFGGEFRIRRGNDIGALMLKVEVKGEKQIYPARRFEDAGLHPVMLDNVVNKCQYPAPTAIQQYTIPAILQGNDVIAVAQTGSGKTAAYLVPVLSRLMGKAKKMCVPKPTVTGPSFNALLHGVRAEPLVVIVVPTRELAIQVFDECRRLCYRSMLRPVVAYGGLPLRNCLDELAKGCDILIASPGRLCDLMDRPQNLTMSRIKYTILDEADEMLHHDWQEELSKIMSGGDANEDADHAYIMVSATFPKQLRKLAREYMANDHYVLRVGRAGSTHANVTQNVLWTERDKKRDALFDLLYNSEPQRTLIFCNSKATVDQVDDFLYNRHLPTTSIHSGRSQREREDSIRAFRSGRAPILIATGISARGWDIANIAHVINYDLPSAMHGGIDEYVHRIGRTARMGNKGMATSFYNERDEELAQSLVNVLAEFGGEIPDFLEQYKPEDSTETKSNDDSADDDEAVTETGDGDNAESEANANAAEAGVAAGSGGDFAWGAASAAHHGACGFTADSAAEPMKSAW